MSAHEAQARAELAARTMWATDKASQGLGMEIKSIAPGAATITMPDNAIGEMAGTLINSLAPMFFAKAESFLDGWIKSSIAKIKTAP